MKTSPCILLKTHMTSTSGNSSGNAGQTSVFLRKGDTFELRRYDNQRMKVHFSQPDDVEIEADSRYVIVRTDNGRPVLTSGEGFVLGYADGSPLRLGEDDSAGDDGDVNNVRVSFDASDTPVGQPLKYGTPIRMKIMDTGRYIGFDDQSMQIIYTDLDSAAVLILQLGKSGIQTNEATPPVSTSLQANVPLLAVVSGVVVILAVVAVIIAVSKGRDAKTNSGGIDGGGTGGLAPLSTTTTAKQDSLLFNVPFLPTAAAV
jgi:hypothetical protein